MRMRVALLLLSATAATTAAAAPAKRLLALTPPAKGSLSREVPAAVDRMMAAGDTRLALGPEAAKVECIDIAEVSETTVCVFNTAHFMNYALNRASEWLEVSRRKAVLSDRDHVENATNDRVEGHDLKGADLRAFDDAWKSARGSFEKVDREGAPEILRIEADFWDAFLRPRLKKSPDLVLLAVAAGTDIEHTLSHEILHAQYFRSKEMRRIVADYWASMPASDRDTATSALRASYAVDGDSELLVNEFQAYILMHGADGSELAPLAATHRDPLFAKLHAAKIEPIQFALPDR